VTALAMNRRECATQPVRTPRRRLRGRSDESGYAYLMALFLVLMVIVGSMVLLTNAATDARRQSEDEMMWRGKQYTRAIKLYYRKTGHYPQSLDDLQKGVGNIHFLRRAYKDPMNQSEDGKWRFIYTNATGQLIGSVRYASMQQMAILDLNGGIIPGANGDSESSQDANVTPVPQPDQGTSSSNGNCPPALGGPGEGNQALGSGISTTNSLNSNKAQPSNPQAGCQPNQGQSNSTQNPPQAGGLLGGLQMGGGQLGGNLQAQQLQTLAQMKPTGPVDSPVIGGFIVGVGSTVDAKSIRVYKRGKKYKDWEFIWNPLEDQALAVQQGMNQAAGLLGQGGLGSQPGSMGANGSSASPSQQAPTGSQPQQQQQPQ
jgi:hypothetical protein